MGMRERIPRHMAGEETFVKRTLPVDKVGDKPLVVYGLAYHNIDHVLKSVDAIKKYSENIIFNVIENKSPNSTVLRKELKARLGEEIDTLIFFEENIGVSAFRHAYRICPPPPDTEDFIVFTELDVIPRFEWTQKLRHYFARKDIGVLGYDLTMKNYDEVLYAGHVGPRDYDRDLGLYEIPVGFWLAGVRKDIVEENVDYPYFRVDVKLGDKAKDKGLIEARIPDQLYHLGWDTHKDYPDYFEKKTKDHHWLCLAEDGMCEHMVFQDLSRLKKLHVGCGTVRLEGWINTDVSGEVKEDVVDVTKPLPYENLGFIFSEHMIEHITREQGQQFFKECFRSLAESGVVRVATPDLDYIVNCYKTGWDEQAWVKGCKGVGFSMLGYREMVSNCEMLNIGMYEWNHKHLYNEKDLRLIMEEAGFKVTRCDKGKSNYPGLCNLEIRDDSKLILEGVK